LGDLRPKLPENVETDVLSDGRTDLPHGRGEFMLMIGMVGAGDNDSTKPLIGSDLSLSMRYRVMDS